MPWALCAPCLSRQAMASVCSATHEACGRAGLAWAGTTLFHWVWTRMPPPPRLPRATCVSDERAGRAGRARWELVRELPEGQARTCTPIMPGQPRSPCWVFSGPLTTGRQDTRDERGKAPWPSVAARSLPPPHHFLAESLGEPSTQRLRFRW